MYCKDCQRNWAYVPGKRYFVTEPAVERDALSLSCPECTEPETEVEARKLGRTDDQHKIAALGLSEDGTCFF